MKVIQIAALLLGACVCGVFAQDATGVSQEGNTQVVAPQMAPSAPVEALETSGTGGASVIGTDSAVTSEEAPPLALAPPVAKRMLNVAVLPFTGNFAVNAKELNAITSRFESELMAQGTFRVLERRNVEAIMREQGFQQSGACNTSDCQVQVGQMLGVERIVTGEVTRMEKLWSLNLRMVDVGTGAVASSHVLDIKGKLETVLRGGCPEMAEILAGKKQPTGTRTVLAEEKKGISPWVWVAGGTVIVGGGVAAALLLTQDDGGSSATKPVAPRDITLTLDTGR